MATPDPALILIGPSQEFLKTSSTRVKSPASTND
jgi:hypothetical protein